MKRKSIVESLLWNPYPEVKPTINDGFMYPLTNNQGEVDNVYVFLVVIDDVVMSKSFIGKDTFSLLEYFDNKGVTYWSKAILPNPYK